MTPTDADWWWQYGLDGLAGGVIGGAVTAGAVVVTLRHERRMAELQEARALASRIHTVAWTLLRDIHMSDGEELPEQQIRDLVGAAFELQARTTRRWPDVGKLVDESVDRVLKEARVDGDRRSAADAATTISAVIASWIEDPKSYEVPRRAGIFRALGRRRKAR